MESKSRSTNKDSDLQLMGVAMFDMIVNHLSDQLGLERVMMLNTD